MIKPINTIQENVGDFTDSLTPNALVHKRYVDVRKNADEIVATEAIAAFLPVTVAGGVCDSTNIAHRGKLAGISEASIANGFTGLVQYGGEIVNPSWAFAAGSRIYVNGQILSSTAPTSGWLQCVGVAINATTILINIELAILL